MSPSDTELDKRVEAAIERLNARAAEQRVDVEPPPTVERFNVVSDLTGAIVCPQLESRRTAEGEADRLNGEARQVIGEAGRGSGKTLHAGSHRGRVTTYSVRPVEIVDTDAVRDNNIARLEAAIRDSDGDTREAYEAELGQYRASEGLTDG